MEHETYTQEICEQGLKADFLDKDVLYYLKEIYL